MDGFFSFFPYLLLYRTEEAAGSNPARSTDLDAFHMSGGECTGFSYSLLLLYRVYFNC